MKEDKCCCCSSNVTTILACSGGSNVGQITNEVAKRLDIAGVGKFFCLAGIGGHISGMVASVEGSDTVLVIDGCPVACAKKTMEAAGLRNYKYVVVTDLGIDKSHDFTLGAEDVERVMSVCLASVGGLPVAEVANEA
ncbi:MAG: putative zinc-binding protein [Desulfitobacteriaceae bacterium]|nr:putative zinc-binding protein [Desulfitobacteriaceae bacterium]